MAEALLTLSSQFFQKKEMKTIKMKKEPMTKKEMIKHFQEHIDYPATKREIVKACGGMMDISNMDRKLIEKNLPDRVYNNSNEVMKVLNL